MNTFLTICIFIAMGATLVALAMGLFNTLRGNETKKSPQYSNKMMRLRVMFQGAAIILFLLALWLGK